MADFGSAGTLPLVAARRIWLYLSYKERLLLESVHPTWQRPSMHYGNESMQFQMHQPDLESFVSAVLKFLQRNGTHLRRIALRFGEIPDNDRALDLSELMIGITQHCVHLKTLDIRGTGLTMDYVSFLPRNLTSLTLAVSLPGDDLDASIPAISASLNQLSCLRELAITCAPSRLRMEPPVQLDLNLSQLRVARFCRILPNVMRLRQNSPNLVGFWLNTTSSYEDSGMQDALSRLTSCPQLRSFRLLGENPGLHDRDLAKLCSALPNLEDVALSSVTALDFSPLCRLGRLRSFWVNESEFRYEDCRRLLDACPLTRLGIRRTHVGQKSCAEVAAVVECPSLRRFCFGNDYGTYIPLCAVKDAFHLTHVAYWRPRESDLLDYLRYRVQRIGAGAAVGDVKLYLYRSGIPPVPEDLYEQAKVQLYPTGFSEFSCNWFPIHGDDQQMECLEFWDK